MDMITDTQKVMVRSLMSDNEYTQHVEVILGRYIPIDLLTYEQAVFLTKTVQNIVACRPLALAMPELNYTNDKCDRAMCLTITEPLYERLYFLSDRYHVSASAIMRSALITEFYRLNK